MIEYIDRDKALDALQGRIKLSEECLPYFKEYLDGINERIKAIPSADVVERKHGKKHITNADRIRSMTDEELAKFLDCYCVSASWECPRYHEIKCYECWIEWLKKEKT